MLPSDGAAVVWPRWALATFFVGASVLKLSESLGATDAPTSPLLPTWWPTILVVIAVAEAAVGAFLLTRWWPIAVKFALALTGSFFATLAWLGIRGIPIAACGCLSSRVAFSQRAHVAVLTVVFSLCLIVLSAARRPLRT
jgi:hypothetical protein